MKPNKNRFNPIFDVVQHDVVISNYIIKSPPKEKLSNALVRWCMRWFVLYYKRASRACWLMYYENEEAYHSGKPPKGKIDLKHTKIKKHKGNLNKYDYVIDIIAVKRTYYLCFLSRRIYEEWLTKLQEVHQDVWSNEIAGENDNTVNSDDMKTTHNDVESGGIIEIKINDNNADVSIEQRRDGDPCENDDTAVDDGVRHGVSHVCDDNNNNNTKNHSDSSDEEIHRCCQEDSEEDELFSRGFTGISTDRPHSCTVKIRSRNPSLDFSVLGSNDSIGDALYMTPSLTAKRQSLAVPASTLLPRCPSAQEEEFKSPTRYDSLPNLSARLTTSPGENIHFEILARLKAAASKRPSLINDYDMGCFCGPKIFFNGC